ncbi:unnamed protein product, partial [Phaeothamnion confervicola]
DDEFGPDPFWDGDWDIDRSMLGDEEDAGEDVSAVPAVLAVPESDEAVLALTRQWVQAVVTDLGVCPFMVSADRAGLPVGNVHYPLSASTTAEEVYRDYWREVAALMAADERSASTTLLVTPRFGLENSEAFDVLAGTLTPPLESWGLEDDIQLVFFHPQYSFRDGRDRIGVDGAANFARRSPFPMINILRTPQV